MNRKFLNLLETYFIAFCGGILFFLSNLPIPWILGPMTAVILYKFLGKRKLHIPKPFYNGGLIILGIYFGLYFTVSTFLTVSPYIIPFIVTTMLLLTISVINSILITKFIKVDPITSVFGSIPGGLSEMVAASESLRANPAMVTIFQTVRLLTVVFFVPFIVVNIFSTTAVDNYQITTQLKLLTNSLPLVYFSNCNWLGFTKYIARCLCHWPTFSNSLNEHYRYTITIYS